MARKKNYSKFDALEYIFMNKTNNGRISIGENIDFTLAEVGEAIVATGGIPPTSYSNFVLDLTRQDRGIEKRLPQSIIKFGYDLRKNTGSSGTGRNDNFCGTFVYRGFDLLGNTIPLHDWFFWNHIDETIEVQNCMPELVRDLLSTDEASLFSVVDYCDLLSIVLHQAIYRIQSPLKLQPNEIDGVYASHIDNTYHLYIVEAKSFNDDINLVQMYGQYITFRNRFADFRYRIAITSIAAKMERTGILLALLEPNPDVEAVDHGADMFNVLRTIRVVLSEPIPSWR